jgi:hypothetical protein
MHGPVEWAAAFFLFFLFFILIRQENKNALTTTKGIEKKSGYADFFLVPAIAKNRGQGTSILGC